MPDEGPHTYKIFCAGSDKIYGNVSLGNAISGVAAVTDGAGLTNNVSNIEASDKDAIFLGGDQNNNSAGTIGSTVTLTGMKGTNSLWWLSGNVVTEVILIQRV